MSIARLYDRIVSTERQAAVSESRKTTYQPHLLAVPCRISEGDGQGAFLGTGAIYKPFKMWCDVEADVLEGDRVIDGTTQYTVRAVKTLTGKRSPHREVILELAQ